MIRKLTSNDIQDFENWITEIPQTPIFNWTQTSLMESFKNDICWGLWDHQSLQSVICLSQVSDPLEILWLATMPASMGQGFMKKLLQALINNAKSQKPRGALEVLLEVHEKNLKAIKLYSDLGFTEFRRRKNYYQDGADAILMIQKIP